MMGIVVLVVSVVLAAVVARLVKSWRRRATRPVAGDTGAPTFEVVALGTRGSGKTLLLASMYHEMQVPAGRGYFLTAPFEQVVLLNQWFTEVADPSLDWPSGTTLADTRQFTFAVRARSASGTPHTIMNLGYLEYAGGLLTDAQAPGSTVQTELLRRIGSAHALLGIIDGYRIRQCLDGNREGMGRLQQSLTAMVRLMMEAPCPITFVVTKWDLLYDIDADEDSRLQIVRKLLMGNPGFRELVRVHGGHRALRLVPVSALGPEFARLDDRGLVEKRPDGELHPTNVDVPLSAVVPDLFDQMVRQLDRARLRATMDDLRRRAGLGPAAALTDLGWYALRVAGQGLAALGPAFIGAGMLELFGPPASTGAQRQELLERQVSAAERELEEFQLAQRAVIRGMQRKVDVLEGRLPSSRLSVEE
jgi:hypothetical protein